MMLNDFGDMVDNTISRNSRIIGGRTKHQQCPATNTHEQRNGCLVDSCQALESNAQIACHKEHHNTDC